MSFHVDDICGSKNKTVNLRGCILTRGSSAMVVGVLLLAIHGETAAATMLPAPFAFAASLVPPPPQFSYQAKAEAKAKAKAFIRGGGAVAQCTRTSPNEKRYRTAVQQSSYATSPLQDWSGEAGAACDSGTATTPEAGAGAVVGSGEGHDIAATPASAVAVATTATASDATIARTTPKELTQAQRLSPEAIVCMSLLAVQFGIQPLLVRRFTPATICKSSVVLMQELVKFVIAGAVYFGGTDRERREKELSGWSIRTWLTIAGVPAALYTVQNLASLLAYQNLDSLSFNVLNQTKILSAALSCFLLLGKKQSKMQMFSLVLLLASALVIQRIVTVNALLSPLFGIGAAAGGLLSSAFASLGPLELSRTVTHGVFPVLLASLISGLAGALTQKNLQGMSSSGSSGNTMNKKATTAPRNAYLFSMEMNAASAIILLASLLVSADGRQIAQSGFFHQWTPQTFIPVVANAMGGIIVGLVTKYAGSVRKGFALIFGILLSGLIQAGGSAGIATEQIVGGSLAAISLMLHTTHPYKPRSLATS